MAQRISIDNNDDESVVIGATLSSLSLSLSNVILSQLFKQQHLFWYYFLFVRYV